MPNPVHDDPRLGPALDLLRRTAVSQVQIRYQDDQEPTVWMAVGCWPEDKWEAAGAMNPFRAVLRLLEVVIDGGQCVHCKRVSGFEADNIEAPIDLFDKLICWYQFDPELNVFRRGCEGNEQGAAS